MKKTSNVPAGIPGIGSIYVNPKVASKILGEPDAQQMSTTETLINAEAIRQFRNARWQPIGLLTPETLSSQLSQWNVGTLRAFSLTMDAVESRDAVIKGVTAKLKMALSRRSYEIVKVEGADPDEADAHSDALNFFYANCSATSAVDRNIRGGFNRLVNMIMDAALKKYAPFEIIWEPRGENLTATFVHVPLWFMENHTGRLRFAGNFAWDGIPLKDGQWMIACGEGIMEAITVYWMYKTMVMRDQLIYSERNGMPMPVVSTPNQKGSPAYTALEEALASIGPEKSLILGLQDVLSEVDFGGQGQLIYPMIIEYMDKAIIALARGSDLGTISSGVGEEGNGASLQGDESAILEQHYGQMVSETLNHYIDPWVLRWHFGNDVTPAAYVKLDIPENKNTAMDLQVDEKLIGWGVELGIDNALERYGRVEAGEGDRLLVSQQQQFEQDMAAQQQEQYQGNAKKLTRPNATRLSKMFLGQTHRRLCRQVANQVSPVKHRLESLLALKDDQEFVTALRGLRQDLPSLKLDHNSQRELNGVLEINRV